MMRQRAARLFGFCVLLTFCWAAPIAAQEKDSSSRKRAIDTMQEFLDAWLVKQNEAATMRHIAFTARSLKLAPGAIWQAALNADIDLDDAEQVKTLWSSQTTEYWNVLNRLAVRRSDGELGRTLTKIDPDLRAVLVNELLVCILDTELFTVFIADSDLAIDSFDGGYGDVATALGPAENEILAMVADFAERDREEYAGPFIAFWALDESGERWKIQALGAVPEGRIWRDGRISGFGAPVVGPAGTDAGARDQQGHGRACTEDGG